MMTDQQDTAGTRLVGIAVLAVAFAFFAGLARYGYQLGEDGDILQLIYRTAHGQRPYIDFATGYTPLFFYWHAALLRIFGESVMPIRWSLVATNTLTVWLLYGLARTAMPTVFALIAPLGYAAILLVFPREFCSFNVPYPAWYTTLLSVIAALAMVRWAGSGHAPWVAVAGLAAGLAFSFKPNAGLFVLVGSGLVLICLARSPHARWGRWVWWALLLGLAIGLVGVFGERATEREGRLFLWPVLAVIALRLVYRGVGVTGSERLESRFALSGVALGGAFAAVTVPWLLYFYLHLGWERFIHEVLFIGSGYELFFFMPFHEATMWDYAVVVAAAGIAVAGWAVRKGRLPPTLPLAVASAGAIAAAAYVLLLAPMPEGFQRAVASRVQDLSFGLSLLAHWSGIAALGWAWHKAAQRDRQLPARGIMLVTLLAPAIAMFIGAYPRSDFMHLTISVAATLVLGCFLLSRVAAIWSTALGNRATPFVRSGFAVPAFVVAAVLIAPAANLWGEMRGLGGVRFVSLGLPRAPVVTEEGRYRRLEQLRAVATYLESVTSPGDPIFPFPNLNMLCFLAGRNNPVRIGYFHPGWPDHVAEAEMVTALRRAQPTYAVVLEAHELFITTAPVYYFMLRDYIRENYVEAVHIGQYTVLRRRDLPPPLPPTVAAAAQPTLPSRDGLIAATSQARVAAIETMVAAGVQQVPPEVLAWAESGDAAVQQALTSLVRSSRDALAAAALAEAASRPSVTPRMRSLFLRTASEVGDTRSVPTLLQFVADDGQRDDFALSALYYISSKATIQRYWFAPDPPAVEGLRAADSRALRQRLLHWLDEDEDIRLRFFAAWALGILHEPRAEGKLVQMLGSDNMGLKMAAGQALLDMGYGEGLLDLLINAVSKEDTFVPSMIVELYRRDPRAGAQVLRERLQSGRSKVREVLCWIAGTLHDSSLAGAVMKGLTDDVAQTRMAAAWALGELGVGEARGALQAATSDPNRRVRSFASAALDTLEHGSSMREEPG